MATPATPKPDARPRRILYCRCAFAKVVPLETKDAVLKALAESDLAFDAVPDLCEMAARKDPTLKALAQAGDGDGELCIAACYPRAVRWLFHAAGAPLPEKGVQILNMRTDEPSAISLQLLHGTGVATPEANDADDAKDDLVSAEKEAG